MARKTQKTTPTTAMAVSTAWHAAGLTVDDLKTAVDTLRDTAGQPQAARVKACLKAMGKGGKVATTKAR